MTRTPLSSVFAGPLLPESLRWGKVDDEKILASIPCLGAQYMVRDFGISRWSCSAIRCHGRLRTSWRSAHDAARQTDVGSIASSREHDAAISAISISARSASTASLYVHGSGRRRCGDGADPSGALSRGHGLMVACIGRMGDRRRAVSADGVSCLPGLGYKRLSVLRSPVIVPLQPPLRFTTRSDGA